MAFKNYSLDWFRGRQEIYPPVFRLLLQYLLRSPISKNVFAAGIAPTVHVVNESISDDGALCKVNLEHGSRSKTNHLPDVAQALCFVFGHRHW
jgi:hypothetical protein